MNIIIAAQYEGYNSASQTISELSAIDAPTRSIWEWFGLIYTLLITLFGYGVLISNKGNRNLRLVGILMIVYGLTGIGWRFAPMHKREVIAQGGGTLTDTFHIVLTIITVLLMLIALITASGSFGKSFRLYSIMTIITLIVFGVLTSIEAPGIDANLPTPLIGVWERINVGAFLLWIIVLARMILYSHLAAKKDFNVQI